MKRALLAAIRLYQKTRRFRTQSCRFYPSCSQYAYESMERHGLLAGLLLAGRRLCLCHPLHPGGIDDVPEQLPHFKQKFLSVVTQISNVRRLIRRPNGAL